MNNQIINFDALEQQSHRTEDSQHEHSPKSLTENSENPPRTEKEKEEVKERYFYECLY